MPYKKTFIEAHPLLSILIAAAVVTSFLTIPRLWDPNWLTYSYEEPELSREVFNNINNFRTQNNLPELAESKKAYDLAVYLSKGRFFDRQYLTETQKSALKKRSSLGESTEFFLGVLETQDSEELRLLTARWTSLVTSREAILDSRFTKGAVSCWGKYCSLVLTR